MLFLRCLDMMVALALSFFAGTVLRVVAGHKIRADSRRTKTKTPARDLDPPGWGAAVCPGSPVPLC